jgi:hypothetical protein
LEEIYEGESVNRSQIDIKCNNTWYSNLEKHLFLDVSPTNIDTLVPSLYDCVETRSIEVYWLLSANSAPPFQPLRHQPNVCHVSRPSCEPLYTTNISHRKQETFLYEYPLHSDLLPTKEKTLNRTLLFGDTHLKHGCHFGYGNQPLNIRIYVLYLDCHKAGLCCYLVIHIGNLLRQLQPFYFHLWPIYWFSLVSWF